MLDLDPLKKKGIRLIALVDESLKTAFFLYENLFDQVYYIPLSFSHFFFLNSFPIEAGLAIKAELQINTSLRLISFFEGDIEAVAKLRDQFDIPGLRFKEASFFRNKLLMKEALSSQGILVPKGFPLDLTQSPQELFQFCKLSLGIPFIVKPVHLAASLGIESIKSYDQFYLFYLKHMNTEYMAEEEIHGDLYHLDLVVSQGKIQWFGCSEYNMPTTEFLQHHPIGSIPLFGKNNSIISQNKDLSPIISEIYELYERFKQYAHKISQCFQVQESILHIEVFKTSTHIYFLEIAARPSGGLVVHVYNKMFGYNMIQASVNYQAGMDYEEEKTKGLSYFWACFSSEEEAEESMKKMDVLHCNFFSKQKNHVKEIFGKQHYKILAYGKDYLSLRGKFFALS